MKKHFILTIILFFIISNYFGQIVDPFTIRYQTINKGGLVFLANTSLTCNCAKNDQMPPGGDGKNNGSQMNFVDIDSDASTFMSSSDQLNLPDCSEILWAGLYWEGILNSTPANTANFADRNKVKLSANGSSYTTLTADELFDNTVGKVSYFCFKDITNIVQANPTNTRYNVANVVSETGDNTFGGWNIVVVYRNIYETMKNITVFDGLTNVSGGTSVNIALNGFLTPPTGAVNFELGVVAHDGDRADTGDQLEFNGAGTFVGISDALHPLNDAFNSTISNNGVLTPLRNPSYNNNLGHDANIYSPDNSTFNYIGNSATSASIRISTATDNVLTSVITSSIDIYVPDLRASVSFSDLNGGNVVPGDILEYSITAKNIGSDVSIGTILTDTLDSRLTYIPGSIQISSGPNSGLKTDLTDADQAEFVVGNNVIKARIGSGANGVIGGSVNNSPTGADSTVIKFRVQLTNDCAVWQCGSVLENKAFLVGTGQISGIPNGNNGASDLLDNDGCPSLESGVVNINVSACPAAEITFTDTLCLGETISLSYPNSAFLNFSWTGPNGFTSNISNPTIPNSELIHSGDYILEVSYNGQSCLLDNSVNIDVLPNPTIFLVDFQNDTCFQAGSGFIEVVGVGNGPFTYLWSTLETDTLIQNLIAGFYNVTATDEYGCDSPNNVYEITEPAVLTVSATITSNYNGEDISCFNASDGSANATVIGGIAPFNFSWFPSNQTTDIASDLVAGIHIVTLTDNSGCQAKDTVTLVQPDALLITGVVTDILCFGNNTGDVDATITGGTSPYSSEWSNNAILEDLTNVVAGTYTDTVTDVNGCKSIKTFVISQPTSSMTLSATSTEILCFGASTSDIDLTVLGGVLPYEYLWSSGEDVEDLTGKPAGTYTVNVTDDNDCSQSFSLTIDQPSQISINAVQVNPVCQNGSQGSLNITVSGGTPGYSFNWNTLEVTEDITGLFAGVYECIVTDNNNCTSIITRTLTDPDAVLITETHQDILCYGDATGSIDITPSNGTEPYTFIWSHNVFSEDVNGLIYGPYTVVVKDNDNCGGFMSFFIDQPDTLLYIVSSTVNDVLCFGGNTGEIDIEVAGGTTNYSYEWNNTLQIQDIDNLTVGTYSVLITDANGCELNHSENVQEPTVLNLTETHIDVLCFGTSTASIDITTTGGTSPYTYIWSNALETEDLINIPIGSYSLLVEDFNNCQDNITVVITEPSAALDITHTSNPVLCYDGNDGSVDITVIGGTSGYTYLWNTSQTDEDISALIADTFIVEVTDANGCKKIDTTIITQPDSPVSLISSANQICFGATNGEAKVVASGGVPTYTYLWSTSANDTLDILSNLLVGTYKVTVTDANGCQETISVSVEQPSELEGCVSLEMPNVFTPSSDGLNNFYIPAKAFNIKDYHILIINRWGELVYEGNEFIQGWDGNIKGKEASKGVYFWTVEFTDNYGESGKLQGNLMLVRE
ncbi:MAG: gliding motility-associated C-terminal domain-containing protein [Bacteroidota bacterium]